MKTIIIEDRREKLLAYIPTADREFFYELLGVGWGDDDEKRAEEIIKKASPEKINALYFEWIEPNSNTSIKKESKASSKAPIFYLKKHIYKADEETVKETLWFTRNNKWESDIVNAKAFDSVPYDFAKEEDAIVVNEEEYNNAVWG